MYRSFRVLHSASVSAVLKHGGSDASWSSLLTSSSPPIGASSIAAIRAAHCANAAAASLSLAARRRVRSAAVSGLSSSSLSLLLIGGWP